MAEVRPESALTPLFSAHAANLQTRHLAEIKDIGLLNLRVTSDDLQSLAIIMEVTGLSADQAPNTYSIAERASLFWMAPDERLLMLPRSVVSDTESALFQSNQVQSNQGSLGVTDVSSGYTIVELSSQCADKIVRSVCPYDVARLTDGRCAQTLVGKSQVLIWKLDTNTYRFLFRRSFANYGYQRLVDAVQQWEGDDE